MCLTHRRPHVRFATKKGKKADKKDAASNVQPVERPSWRPSMQDTPTPAPESDYDYDLSPPASLLIEVLEEPVITSRSHGVEYPEGLQDELYTAQHQQPTVHHDARKPLSPMWKRLVSLFAGKRRHPRTPTHHTPTNPDELSTMIPAQHSTAPDTFLPSTPAIDINPNLHSQAIQPTPDVPNIHSSHPYVHIIGLDNPLAGYARVEPDIWIPEVTQRGFDVECKIPVNLPRIDSVMDRKGDPWAVYWERYQSVHFRAKAKA